MTMLDVITGIFGGRSKRTDFYEGDSNDVVYHRFISALRAYKHSDGISTPPPSLERMLETLQARKDRRYQKASDAYVAARER